MYGETHEEFKSQPNYTKTEKVWKDENLLKTVSPDSTKIVINLKTQRAQLLWSQTSEELCYTGPTETSILIDYPICSGKRSTPTPTGTYTILEKIPKKSSNKYGSHILLPDGTSKFIGAPMNYWMRLTEDGVGHHIGPMSRTPSSHACIRGPWDIMPIIYQKVKVGTEILIEN
jgi:lipoprotein-anchoring transpeptidase ErfK/SrfK